MTIVADFGMHELPYEEKNGKRYVRILEST